MSAAPEVTVNFSGPHHLSLDEGQRQLALMALAHLAIERPGFDHALAEIAAKIDNVDAAGRPDLYDKFRALALPVVQIGEAGMTPRYPGHDPEAALQHLGWRGLERFDGGDALIPLGPGAKRLAAAAPPDLRPELPANTPGGRTVAANSPFSRDRESVAVQAIAAFPKKKNRRYGPKPPRMDKAICRHLDGWQKNGNGTTPGMERLKCRACGLNRQHPKDKR